MSVVLLILLLKAEGLAETARYCRRCVQKRPNFCY